MRNYRLWRLPFVFLLIAASALFLISCTRQQTNKQAVSASQLQDSLPHDPISARLIAATELTKAKDFKTELLNGETFRLSEHRGEVVILNIWATWCPPCIEEMPDLVDIYETYKDEGLIILGVSIDNQGRSVVVPFVEKYNITYPITIDDGTIMKKYGPTMGIPTTYIIGEEGYLRYFATGALTKQELKPRIEKLLNEELTIKDT